MSSDVVAVGYGFEIYTGNNIFAIWEFIQKNGNLFPDLAKDVEQIREWIADECAESGKEELDEEELEGILEEYYCGDISGIIARIIGEQTGLKSFVGVSCRGYTFSDSSASVIYIPSYPWTITGKDKDVTEEQIHEICKKYCKELQIPESSIGYMEMEL